MTIIVTTTTAATTEPLSSYYDDLLPELPGCTTAMLDHALLQVVREFCEATHASRVNHPAVDTVAGQGTYAIQTGVVDTEAVAVKSLTVNGILLWEDTDSESLNRDDQKPKYRRDETPFSMLNGLGSIVLIDDEVPTAGVVAGLELIGSIQPTLEAEELPYFLRSQHGKALRFGVLARLMLMAKKPWTDRELAMRYEKQWNSAKNFAAYQGAVGNTRRVLRVKKWG